ncbi:hypothetical protein Rsub_10532 [Raphidocelis subcapitata]|uniref:Apple domain-containing protein n=1 Tax=Raphidocelis subcapitata TaxID=307507 RepID=A0A2V0PCT7_9CHLO|nr:hypothetical protein Rsub_10532 [Raphidocelis subcapitata]|eukprot:GBF97656.1 hypothetical protein Rsub_10532 [Raphidocelis subcapitata]
MRGLAGPRPGLALAVALAMLCAGPAAALNCNLTMNFQNPGFPNVPFGWTAEGQAALKAPNGDPGWLRDIQLAAFPVPTLYVAPAHPFLGAVSSCVADCLPAAGSRRRLQQEAAAAEPAGDGAAAPAAAPAGDGAAAAAAAPAVAAAAPAVDAAAAAGGGEAAAGGGEAAAGGSGCGKATDPGNLLEPASWSLWWNLDGGKKVELGPFKGLTAPAVIKLDKLADALKGEHYLELEASLEPESASVSGAGAQPTYRMKIAKKIYFDLVDAAAAPDPAGPAGVAAAAPAAAAAAGNATAAPAAAAGNATAAAAAAVAAAAGAAAAAPAAAAATPGVAAAIAAGPGAPAPDPADAAAVKYYCALNFNVGGAIKRNTTVERVPEDGPLSPGAFQCARECNKMGSGCAAFGVVAGTSCYLMSAVNTTAGGADSLVTAVCMKNLPDWMALGAAHGVAAARDRYYCLPTFDVQGWPAGQGPDADEFGGPAKQPAVTDFPLNTEPIVCASQCSTTPGCEFFVQVKPAGCYLKTRPFDMDSRYGKTGPDTRVDVSCFRGEETWTRAGSILDGALPQLPVVYSGGGVLTGAVAGAAGVPGNASALTYYCIREYSIGGVVLSNTTVGAGDVGTVACAAACDVAGAACAAHMTDALGTCTLFRSYALNATAPDSLKFALCFKSVKEWEDFGKPDRNGMYCVKKYDIAGDGITTRDFVTISSGAGAVEFCKGQCQQLPECEFTVTQLTKCYLKSNIAGGTYGKTGASPQTDATCVKGADNWLKVALQVSNQPAAASLPGLAGIPGLPPGAAIVPLQQRRNASAMALNGGGAARRRGGGGAAAAAGAGAALWLVGLLA